MQFNFILSDRELERLTRENKFAQARRRKDRRRRIRPGRRETSRSGPKRFLPRQLSRLSSIVRVPTGRADAQASMRPASKNQASEFATICSMGPTSNSGMPPITCPSQLSDKRTDTRGEPTDFRRLLLWRQSAKILPQSAAALGAWIDRLSLDASDEVSESLSNPPLTIGWIAQTAVPAADVQARDENAAEPAAYLADAAFCPALAANVRSKCWSNATCECESNHSKPEEDCA